MNAPDEMPDTEVSFKTTLYALSASAARAEGAIVATRTSNAPALARIRFRTDICPSIAIPDGLCFTRQPPGVQHEAPVVRVPGGAPCRRRLDCRCRGAAVSLAPGQAHRPVCAGRSR